MPPPELSKTSAYSRSRTFRWGVWALGLAFVLILWGALKDSMIAKKESLFTLDGVVLEHRTSESGGNSRVRLKTGGSASIQGQPTQKTYLKVKSKEGLIKEFNQDEWYPTPKAGWGGQPIRVQYDRFDNLYEIVVAGELIRDASTTVKYRKIDNKKSMQFIVFLIVVGAPMTVIGFLLSLRRPNPPTTPPPSSPPPIPQGQA